MLPVLACMPPQSRSENALAYPIVEMIGQSFRGERRETGDWLICWFFLKTFPSQDGFFSRMAITQGVKLVGSEGLEPPTSCL